MYDPASAAAIALQALNSRIIYGEEIKVNWFVVFSALFNKQLRTYANNQKEDTSTHFKLFVGGLAAEIDDQGLFNAFAKFGSLSDAKVMWDQVFFSPI